MRTGVTFHKRHISYFCPCSFHYCSFVSVYSACLLTKLDGVVVNIMLCAVDALCILCLFD